MRRILITPHQSLGEELNANDLQNNWIVVDLELLCMHLMDGAAIEVNGNAKLSGVTASPVPGTCMCVRVFIESYDRWSMF